MTDRDRHSQTEDTELGLSRRRLLRTGAAVGIAGTLPQISVRAAAQSVPASPDLDKFVQPLSIPEIREPDGTRNGADAYRISREEFTQNLHPDLPETTVWGFDGTYPGPLIEAQRGEPITVHFDDSGLPTEHMFKVVKSIPGTTAENHPQYGKDVSVPEVRAVTHFHGLEVEPENDGQSMMWTSPEGVVGPGFVNEWQRLPMDQARTTSTYHDHTLGIVRLNAYAGLLGMYTIQSQADEDLNLPSGEYDIPLLLQDKTFNSDGSLYYPDEFVPSFVGDTAVINGGVWPYMEVEPRRYRFRLVNGANHRTFSLKLENESGQGVPMMYQFAPGHGFLESVVPIGPNGDLSSLVIQPFERGEVIVDFSDYAGETLTLTNNAELPYEGNNSGSDLSELMQFQVANPTEEPADRSANPTSLNLPFSRKYDENDASVTREMTLDLTYNQEVGSIKHTLNGYGFVESVDDDEKGIVKPQLGATEIWKLSNTTNGAHPIHLHLVTFRVIGRGPDGTEPPDPNERGHKDTVRVEPNETVRILTRFDGYTGHFPWHCHMLEHEDYEMMLRFVVQDGGDSDGPPVIGDSDSAPTDPDGDGLYEDLDGDGEVTDVDGELFFEHIDDPEMQNNAEYFDFNGNGRLDFDDVVEWRKKNNN
ncbi:multicopper oxidase domain-containing protein [Halococcus sediminicola]|uniref:multicopper oxidase domain-containing protein n=1 Tax=Halococcus sediminicola TaxID=1264579 RepID=UPI0009AE3437|nr:multicopper oxidase domain-containing protein [Halococcus sediminicola]